MGIVAIVDILITASSVQVQVELYATQVVEYTDIWCSAYPSPPAGADPIDTIHHVHMLNPQNDLNIMPPLLVDAFGVPLATESPYWIVCHADELTYGIVHHHLLQTIVTTHTPDGCHTGVHLIDPSGSEIHLDIHGPIQDTSVDLGHTNYYKFPSGIRGLSVYDVPRPLPADSSLKITCCRGQECVFWVTLYVCPECTGPREDGLRSELLSSGWDAGACSPCFDDSRKTISFHKHVNANAATYNEMVYNTHDEIAVVFGLEGCVYAPWCARLPGPHPFGGGGCGRDGDCPSPFNML